MEQMKTNALARTRLPEGVLNQLQNEGTHSHKNKLLYTQLNSARRFKNHRIERMKTNALLARSRLHARGIKRISEQMGDNSL